MGDGPRKVFTTIFGAIFLLAAVSSCTAVSTKVWWTQHTVSFTVGDKERVNSGQSSYFLVYTDNGVYKNSDTLLGGKFNSADLQGELKVGTEYNARVYGWRIPIFSMYKNILAISEKETHNG